MQSRSTVLISVVTLFGFFLRIGKNKQKEHLNYMHFHMTISLKHIKSQCHCQIFF